MKKIKSMILKMLVTCGIISISVCCLAVFDEVEIPEELKKNL